MPQLACVKDRYRLQEGGRTSRQRVGWGGQEKEVQKGGLLMLWRLESLELVSSELDLLPRQVDGVALARGRTDRQGWS